MSAHTDPIYEAGRRLLADRLAAIGREDPANGFTVMVNKLLAGELMEVPTWVVLQLLGDLRANADEMATMRPREGDEGWAEKAAARMSRIASIPESMIDAALSAIVPGGAPVSAWLPQKDAWTPQQTARDVIRYALYAALTQRPPEQAGAGNARDRAIAAMRAYVESAGVPISEFDPEFVVRMMAAMMVSFHKYGRVADAYPLKFDAASDVRARMKKYRETGNRYYLVDAANFAMIEAMHPSRASEWAGNDAADSPGRTTASGHRLVQEDNAGNRIIGETILHVPGDEA